MFHVQHFESHTYIVIERFGALENINAFLLLIFNIYLNKRNHNAMDVCLLMNKSPTAMCLEKRRKEKVSLEETNLERSTANILYE